MVMVKRLLCESFEWRHNPKWDLGNSAEAIWDDPRLSFRARGVWGYMRSKPPMWDFSASRMAMDGAEGRRAILDSLKELEELGYLSRSKLGNGRVVYKLSGNAYVGIEPKIDRSSLEGAEVCVDEGGGIRIKSRSDIVDFIALAYTVYGVSRSEVAAVVEREGLDSCEAARSWMDRTRGVDLVGGAKAVPF